MVNKKILSVTGGATKFIQLVVAMIETWKKGFRPTDLVVISASSIAALPFVMGMFDSMIHEGLNLELKKFFKVSPVNKKGKFSLIAILRAIWSLFPGNKIYSFGVQDVTGLLTKYITEEIFDIYKEGDYPNIHVITVNYDTGEVVPVNLKHCTYQEMLDAINASSNIPILTKDLNGFVDGGAFCKIAGGYLIQEGYFKYDEIDTIVSIHSWDKIPKKRTGIDYTESIFTNTVNAKELDEYSKSFYSQYHEYWICRALKINRISLFIPNVIGNLYEVDEKVLKLAKTKTEKYIKEQLENIEF